MTAEDAANISRLRELYSAVCRADISDGDVKSRIVAEIESIVGKPFSSTSEFHRIVNEYLAKKTGNALTSGEQLKRERKRYGLTQGALARAIGVTKMAVSHYESGRSPLSKTAQEWLNSDKGPIRGKVNKNGKSI